MISISKYNFIIAYLSVLHKNDSLKYDKSYKIFGIILI